MQMDTTRLLQEQYTLMMTLTTSASRCLQEQLSPLLRLHGAKGWVHQQDYPLGEIGTKEKSNLEGFSERSMDY
jgi:hypothetical protein